MEFTQAARLRVLIAVAGGEILQLDRQAVVIQRVLQQRAHHARRTFGPQCDRAPAFVVEGIHFLLHHVGRFTYRALKQARILKNGRADLPEAVHGALAAHDVLDHLPVFALARKDVLGTLLCLDQFHLIASYDSSIFSLYQKINFLYL